MCKIYHTFDSMALTAKCLRGEKCSIKLVYVVYTNHRVIKENLKDAYYRNLNIRFQDIIEALSTYTINCISLSAIDFVYNLVNR